MVTRLLATIVTTTSYGSWLPGDMRGYVENGIILPGDPARMELATRRMASREPLRFTAAQQQRLFEALSDTAKEFSYELSDASVESWHVHWLVRHGFDPIPTMVGRLKNRMRQSLAMGRIWTEGDYDSRLFDVGSIQARSRYIAKHVGCRMTDGVVLPR